MEYPASKVDPWFLCPACEHKATSKASLDEHVAIHADPKPFSCAECDFKTTRQLEFSNHMLTHTKENSLGHLNHLSSASQSLPSETKQIKCPDCEYRDTSNVSMKQHMATHRSSDVYICNEDKCTFECTTTDDLQRHSSVHLNHGNNSRRESYSDILQHNNQTLNNDGFIGPMRNGKPPKATDKHRNAYNSPPRPPIPSKNNHSPEQYSQQHAHSGPRRGFIRGSNNGSSLAVPTRPHWAKIFAS